MGERVGRVSYRTPYRGDRGRRAAVDFVVWFGWCGFLSFFLFVFFFLRTHTACCKYEAASCLIYLSTSTGVRIGCHYLIIRSVGVRVRVYVFNIRRFY